MRNGCKVYDADTHVNPAAHILDQSHSRRGCPNPQFTGQGTVWKGSQPARPRVQDYGAENRVKDMDDEGSDVHFLISTGWLSVVALDDVSLEVGLIHAFHRYMADFCGQFPERLQGLIVASTRDVDAAVQEIQRWGTSKWAVAVSCSGR